MTGDELNYAFQQTVSSEYTFGAGCRLIDSFPSWPDMERKKFFNPYRDVRIFYEIDESFNIQGASYALITNSGIDTSFNSSEYEYIEVKLRVCIKNRFITGFYPIYYEDKEYLRSDVLFDFVINNIGNKSVHLAFKASDVLHDGNNGFVYDKTINVLADGVKRKLYYTPKNHMRLHTSKGDIITLNNSASQLYTYI